MKAYLIILFLMLLLFFGYRIINEQRINVEYYHNIYEPIK